MFVPADLNKEWMRALTCRNKAPWTRMQFAGLHLDALRHASCILRHSPAALMTSCIHTTTAASSPLASVGRRGQAARHSLGGGKGIVTVGDGNGFVDEAHPVSRVSALRARIRASIGLPLQSCGTSRSGPPRIS